MEFTTEAIHIKKKRGNPSETCNTMIIGNTKAKDVTIKTLPQTLTK